eukprot:SAG11_NODE_415_length_9675_cov_2.425961_2_plen_1302_part_00
MSALRGLGLAALAAAAAAMVGSGRGAAREKPRPPPPPPPPAGGSGVYAVDLDRRGPPLHSVGAQATAGTARLLFDYPAAQRVEILDLLFKPGYGAAFQHLKVEIGGDAQISCGAEPSFARTANSSDDDVGRGYSAWLMAEARRRNPRLSLLGLVYAWPGWISPANHSPWDSPQTTRNAIDYMVRYVGGLKAAKNLTMDWVGCWNEREYSVDYVTGLRAALDVAGHGSTAIVASDDLWEPVATDFLQSPAVRKAVAALTQHYPHCDARHGVPQPGCGSVARPTSLNTNALLAHAVHGVPLFSTEDYSSWTDRFGAAVWAKSINSNFVSGNITMISAWYLVGGTYPSTAFWNEGIMLASQPWSGHYVVSPTLWASAHTTQFTQPGWRYLVQGSGSGALVGGGTFVSFVGGLDGDAGAGQPLQQLEVTIVVESAGPAVGPFAAGNAYVLPYGAAVAAQNATFVLKRSNSSSSTLPASLACWRSLLGGLHGTTADDIFERLPDVPVSDAGHVELEVEPDALYTLSTIRTSTKAGGPDTSTKIPPPGPFPLPYFDNFEGREPPLPARFWTDMDGAFEVSAEAGVENQVLRQAVPALDCCSFIGPPMPQHLDGPLAVSILGSPVWRDVTVAISVKLPVLSDDHKNGSARPGGLGLLGLRAKFGAGTFFKGGMAAPTGLFLAVDCSGFQLVPAMVASGLRRPCKPPSCLASGPWPVGSAAGRWHRLNLTAVGRTISWIVDGVAGSMSLYNYTSVATGGGFAAIAADYTAVEFDNFTLDKAAAVAQPSQCSPAVPPAAGMPLRSVPCGEPLTDSGAKWEVHAAPGIAGPISLRSDPSLCIVLGGTSTVGPVFDGAGEQTPAPAMSLVLAQCADGDVAQWVYSPDAAGGIVHKNSNMWFGPTAGAPGSDLNVIVALLGKSTRQAPPVAVWWSPDTGYLHGDSNHPMACTCVAVCGRSALLQHTSMRTRIVASKTDDGQIGSAPHAQLLSATVPPAVWVQPATQKVQLGDLAPDPATATSSISFAAQQGECERAFVVVRDSAAGRELHNLTLELPAVPVAGTVWSVLQQGYLFANATTNLLWAPDLVNTSAGWLPDPLLPIAAGDYFAGHVAAGISQAVLVEVCVPGSAQAGNYSSQLTIRGCASICDSRGVCDETCDTHFSSELPIDLEIWPLRLPPLASKASVGMQLNLRTANLAEALPGDYIPGCYPLTDRRCATNAAWLRFMTKHRMGPSPFPSGDSMSGNAATKLRTLLSFGEAGSQLILLGDVSGETGQGMKRNGDVSIRFAHDSLRCKRSFVLCRLPACELARQ